MKKWLATLMVCIIAIFMLAGCSSSSTTKSVWNNYVSAVNKGISKEDISGVAGCFYTSGTTLYNNFVDSNNPADYFGDVVKLSTKSFKVEITNINYQKVNVTAKLTMNYGQTEEETFPVYFEYNSITSSWVFCNPITINANTGDLGNTPDKSYNTSVVLTTTIEPSEGDEFTAYGVNYNYVYADQTNFIADPAKDTITYITPVKNLKNVLIPSSIDGVKVTAIADYAFYSVFSILNTTFSTSKMQQVTIPSSITSIGTGSFYQCRKLTSLEIPSSVTSVGEYCFASCTKLDTLVIRANDEANYGNKTDIASTGNIKISGVTNKVYVGDVLTLKATYKNEDVSSRVMWTTASSAVSVGTYSGKVTCTAAANDSTPVTITATLMNDDGSLSETIGSVKFTIGEIANKISFGNHSLDRLSGLKYLYIDSINPNTISLYANFALNSDVTIYVPAQNLETWQTSTYFATYSKQIKAWTNDLPVSRVER